MHRTHVSEIEPRLPDSHPIDIKASEIGFDVQGAGKMSSRLLKRGGNQDAAKWLDFIVWATTWSPKTGNPTTSETWADSVPSALKKECPNGKVSNIQVVRESASYPLVSGEIVRIRAICYGSNGGKT